MEDIFISYSKIDVKTATDLARKLSVYDLSVWWDNLLAPGDFFNEVLTEKINSSKVVLVLWTKNSVKSKWVHAEASLALKQDKLIPIKAKELNPDEIPLPFNTLHTLDITDLPKIIKSVSEKLDLDEKQQKKINIKLKRQKRVLLGAGVIALLLFIAFAIGYQISPSIKRFVQYRAEAAKELISPCEGIKVKIGTTLEERRQCVSENKFENFTFQDCESCPEMVVLPSGDFLMGSPNTEVGRDLDEEPQISININSFAISLHEITKAQWQTCVQSGKCRPRPDHAQVTRDSHPIGYISWNDAQDYTRWLSETTGRSYRLPSEAEWEYAARAGSDAPRPWGFNNSEACKYANIGDVSYAITKKEDERDPMERMKRSVALGGQHKCDDKHVQLAPVKSFRPNQYQLYDTIGNVWEWVEDCYFPNYEAIPRDGRPYKTRDCRVSTLRGGSYVSGPASARSANRFQEGRSRNHVQPDFGLRIVRNLP